jgi:hypothetical protein
LTKPEIKDLAASVRARLLNKARETNRPFQELLQYYAMERFLYRLSRSPHADIFILKGALMLIVWQAPQSRPTLDIDLLGKTNNDVNSMVDAIKSICVQEVEPDGLEFDISDIKGERIKEEAEYEGVRVKFRAYLNHARISMQIDIGFGDEVTPGPMAVDYPTILDFPRPSLLGYSRESLVAEKFEAMVKLGMLNSRMKDFYDIYLLCTRFAFDGRILSDAVNKTFKTRGTEIVDSPVPFSDEFTDDPAKIAQWRAFIKRNRIIDAPEELKAVIETVRKFLMPAVGALSKNTAFDKKWNPSGKWK